MSHLCPNLVSTSLGGTRNAQYAINVHTHVHVHIMQKLCSLDVIIHVSTTLEDLKSKLWHR